MTTTSPTPARLPHRRRLIGLGAVGLVAVLVLAGIAATARGSEPTAALEGRTFVSVEAPGRELVEGTRVQLTFDEGHLSARAGCNTMFGTADWSAGLLDAPQLATTMMACSPQLMDQDTWLGDLLASGPALSLDGTTLTVGDADHGLVLVETQD